MIYVLSDIHGNERRFDSIMSQIDLKPEDTLYVLGDVVDRHPGGIRLLRRIMATENMKMILGNHEYMMLRAIGHPVDNYADNGTAVEHWYRNGGKVTHDHLKRLRKSLRTQIVEYLHSLPVEVDLEVGETSYKLVHAAPASEYDGEPRYRNPIYYAVWRRFGPEERFPGDYTLVFGHTPTRYFQDADPMEVWRAHRMIGIDCGSGYPNNSAGRLACLRLDDGKVFYSEENGE